MKFKIKQSILMEHLNYVIKGISSKNLIPILNCIKFELTDEGLYLISTDNEIAIKTFIPIKQIEKVENYGCIVVFGKYIYDIIKKLPNEIINIEEIMDFKLYITTDKSSFNLNCNNVNDFPDLELTENKNPIVLLLQDFKNMINQTIFAVSNQESRPILTGINFKISENKLECTATDSYRLAKKVLILKEEHKEDINIIIPARNLSELVKMFGDESNNIEIHTFNNKVIFKFNSIVMMSKLINGTYIDTSSFLQDQFLITMKVNKNNFFNAIDRASLLTNESEKNIVRLESNNTDITLSSNIPEIGNVVEKVDLIEKIENNIKISFSSRYMLDALKSFDSNEIVLKFNGEIKPIIINNPSNNDLIQLIVPIRTD